MDNDEFLKWSLKAAKWGAEYRRNISKNPVKPDIAPGSVLARLAVSPPENPEPMEEIFADFNADIVPAMTHWQHPGFFAYFPANAAPPSVIAEYVVSAMAAQCMLWQTSPAATELETRMIDWLRQALGLPEKFSGVIQDSASSATLVAVLTMREKALQFNGNREGLSGQARVRIYASSEVHTSIDRAIWISGIGENNLVRIKTTGPSRSMDPAILEAEIKSDLAQDHLPAGIIGCVGGTSIGGTDDIAALGEIAEKYNLYFHVDAAWAGSAMICPEFRTLWSGIDSADSIVFNPHKWLGAQFDCAAHFIAEPEHTLKTLAIKPEYLKTQHQSDLINYSEWSVPLGRRFRALKLWFLLRAYGLSGLRTRIRNHVKWSHALCERLRAQDGFEIMSEPVLSLFSFRHHPQKEGSDIDRHNLDLVERINRDGRIYLTQTLVDGRTAIRFQVGQFDAEESHVAQAFDVITEMVES